MAYGTQNTLLTFFNEQQAETYTSKMIFRGIVRMKYDEFQETTKRPFLFGPFCSKQPKTKLNILIDSSKI